MTATMPGSPAPQAPASATVPAGRLLEIAVAIPGAAVYIYGLGYLISALEAHDAGLPWQSVPELMGRTRVASLGLSAALLGFLTVAALLLGSYLWIERGRWVQFQPPAPRGRFAVSQKQKASISSWAILITAGMAGVFAASAAELVLDAFGVSVSTWVSWAAALACAVPAVLYAGRNPGLPLHRRLSFWVVVITLSVLPFTTRPIGILVFFGAQALALVILTKSQVLRTRPWLLLVLYGGLVGVGYSFWEATDDPLSLERVVLSKPSAVTDPTAPGRTLQITSGGLIGFAGDQLIVAICRVGKPAGFSTAAGLVRVAADTAAISGERYRFNGRSTLSLASLVLPSRFSATPPKRSGICT